MNEWIFLVVGIITAIIPLGIALSLNRKYKSSWILLIFGAAMFVLSLVRIPLNLGAQNIFNAYFAGTPLLVASALFPSATAGIFEEGCRYLGYRYLFNPDRRTWSNGLMYGVGHGGIEAIIFLTLNYVILFVVLRSAPGLLPPEIMSQVADVSAYMPFVALLERIFALCIQVGLSVLVLQCFLQKSFKYMGYAIGLHLIVDFLAVMLVQESIAAAEGVTGAFAVLGLYIIWRFRENTRP
ncbi:MAG: YhfC family intramembrane metalloprotease [Theionarchaea archaeon]|nr:YhfC family intramembrane metalloprotease [Theionarchaea archaeon]MBU7001850.1 YhfC family intramembrane metalloprotease [Theionarchaea archaeon]MBU7020954.1 YhfC family intramembrane metalloprotease [Theionarchaea archaeon]MBU7034007.1 YhfC family intramembrane metalloprotease [Theionarchaea archaeon]MBU7041039.1 YhfC family intramembrane metalloprotease [Theionarchaea archaeon]